MFPVSVLPTTRLTTSPDFGIEVHPTRRRRRAEFIQFLMALKLARLFGTSPEVLLQLRVRFDLERKRPALQEQVKETKPIKFQVLPKVL